MRRFGRASAVATMAVAAMVLTACSSAGSVTEPTGGEVPPGAGDHVTVKFGAIPVADTVGVRLGVTQGFFEDEGLTVDFGNPAAAGASVVAAVIAGDYQVGFSSTLPIMQAIAGGNDLVMIGPAAGSFGDPDKGTNDLIVNPAFDITSPKELEGKSVAINAAGSYAEMLVRYVVAADGGDPDKVEFVQMSLSDSLPALEQGQVQGFSAAPPFDVLALNSGMVSIANPLYEISAEPWMQTTWFASRAAVEANPDLYERIQRAITNSLAYAVDHEAELRDTAAEVVGLDDELAQQIRLNNFDIKMTVDTVSPMARVAVDLGMLASMPDLESIIWNP